MIKRRTTLRRRCVLLVLDDLEEVVWASSTGHDEAFVHVDGHAFGQIHRRVYNLNTGGKSGRVMVGSSF